MIKFLFTCGLLCMALLAFASPGSALCGKCSSPMTANNGEWVCSECDFRRPIITTLPTIVGGSSGAEGLIFDNRGLEEQITIPARMTEAASQSPLKDPVLPILLSIAAQISSTTSQLMGDSQAWRSIVQNYQSSFWQSQSGEPLTSEVIQNFFSAYGFYQGAVYTPPIAEHQQKYLVVATSENAVEFYGLIVSGQSSTLITPEVNYGQVFLTPSDLQDFLERLYGYNIYFFVDAYDS